MLFRYGTIAIFAAALAWGCESDTANYEPLDDDDDGTSDADADADSDADADTDADSDADADADSDADTDADSDADTDADSDADSDTGEQQCVDEDGDWWCVPFDCDDDDPDVHPDQPEIPGNGIDDDCDGVTDEIDETICEPGEIWCYQNQVAECDQWGTSWIPIEDCAPLVCAAGECVDTSQACADAANNHSYIGCEYWAVDMDNTTPGQPYAIAVSNLEAADANVVIEQRSGASWTTAGSAAIGSEQVEVFMLGNTTTSGSYLLGDKAFRVSSDRPVVAYQFNPYAGLEPDNSDICTNDGSLLMPRSVMGKTYYALGYSSNAGNSSMNVIATEDGTIVTVTPANSMYSGSSVPSMSAGVAYDFPMDAAGVLQLNSSSDVSGTLIESDQPVAVFAGSTCAFVPTSVSYCDHIEHQMFPVSTWGQEFVAARSVVRSSNQTPENDYWRIIAAEDGTYVESDQAIGGLPTTLDAGQWVELGVNHTFAISADKPIQVGQYLTGHMATDVPFEGAGGDPAFALVPPHEQFLNHYVFLAPEKYLNDYVVITHPAGVDVLLDGVSVGSNSDCELESYSASWEVTRCLIPDFSHTLESSQDFGITVWGYGGRVSYGYTGGLDLKTINAEVE
ncbi:MAG: IgGFc-binding protein [Polyangia bacterium]